MNKPESGDIFQEGEPITTEKEKPRASEVATDIPLSTKIRAGNLFSEEPLSSKLNKNKTNPQVEFSDSELKELDGIFVRYSEVMANYLPIVEQMPHPNTELIGQPIQEKETEFRQEMFGSIISLIENLEALDNKLVATKSPAQLNRTTIDKIRDLRNLIPSPSLIIEKPEDLETCRDGDLRPCQEAIAYFEQHYGMGLMGLNQLLAGIEKGVVRFEELDIEINEATSRLSHYQAKLREYEQSQNFASRLKTRLVGLPVEIVECQNQELQLSDRLGGATSVSGVVEYDLAKHTRRVDEIIQDLDRYTSYLNTGIDYAKKHPMQAERDTEQPENHFMLCHSMELPPTSKDGRLILTINGSCLEKVLDRRSRHFTLNHPVISHQKGNWDSCPYHIIVPFKEGVQTNGLPAHIDPEDTWFVGDFEIPEGSILLMREGASIPEIAPEDLPKIKIIVCGNTQQESRRILKELGYPEAHSPDFYDWYKALGLEKSSNISHAQSFFKDTDKVWHMFLRGLYRREDNLSLESAVEFVNLIHGYGTGESNEHSETDRVPKGKAALANQQRIEIIQNFLTKRQDLVEDTERAALVSKSEEILAWVEK